MRRAFLAALGMASASMFLVICALWWPSYRSMTEAAIGWRDASAVRPAERVSPDEEWRVDRRADVNGRVWTATVASGRLEVARLRFAALPARLLDEYEPFGRGGRGFYLLETGGTLPPPPKDEPAFALETVEPVPMALSGRRAATTIAGHRLRLPLWPLAFAFAIPPVVVLRRGLVHRRRRRHGLCLKCGYDLRASAARCPECGATNRMLPRTTGAEL